MTQSDTFRRRSATVTAVQYDGRDHQALADRVGEANIAVDETGGDLYVEIRTQPRGWVSVEAGEWVVRLGPDVFDVLSDEVFRDEYASDDPQVPSPAALRIAEQVIGDHRRAMFRAQQAATDGALAVLAAEAVWSIAYAAGQAAVLDGAKEQFAVDTGRSIAPISADDAAAWSASPDPSAFTLVHAWLTAWKPVGAAPVRVWRTGDPEPPVRTRVDFGGTVWIRHPDNQWIVESTWESGGLGIEWPRLLDAAGGELHETAETGIGVRDQNNRKAPR